jgi:hypothetical protein
VGRLEAVYEVSKKVKGSELSMSKQTEVCPMEEWMPKCDVCNVDSCQIARVYGGGRKRMDYDYASDEVPGKVFRKIQTQGVVLATKVS